MKITAIGSGYVSPVSGACLTALDYDCVCPDVDPPKISGVDNGVPIYESRWEEVVKNNLVAGHLRSKGSNLFDTVDMKALGSKYCEGGR